MIIKNNIYDLRNLFLVIVLILIFMSGLKPDVTGAEVKRENKIYKINVSKIRICKGPSIETPPIGSLSKGTLLCSIMDENYKVHKDKIDGIDGEWIEISTNSTGYNDTPGYVFSAYLQDVTADYIAEFFESPIFYCSPENNQTLHCGYGFTTNNKSGKERLYLYKDIQRIIFFTHNCNAKPEVFEYKNYSEIKTFAPAEDSWIIIISKKSGLPVQIFYSQSGYECDE